MIDNIIKIPKIEQHVHLEGTISPKMAMILADRHGHEFPKDFINNGKYNWQGFEGFLKAYDVVASCIKTADDYSDVIYDYLVRSSKEGVIFSEIGYSPFHGMMNCCLSHEDLLACLIDGIQRAKDKTGIEARLLCTAVRYLGSVDAVKTAEDIAIHLYEYDNKYVTGFGLAGWERDDDVLSFSRAYEIAYEAGKNLTVHAGENCGPVSVWNALKAIPNLKRIGHGVRSIEDKKLIKEIIKRDIVLEVCPSSNIVLGVLEGVNDIKDHPLPKLIDMGVKCTINSDDPPFFYTSMGREFQLLHDKLDFSIEKLVAISRVSIDSAFVEDEVKIELHTSVDAT